MKIYINEYVVKKTMFLKGYNNATLALEIGISQSYLSQILKRKRNPSPKIASMIAEKLEIEIEDLFEIYEKEEV
ncbi:helix-turn-helix transcriptional regulator [Mammaliicoccus sciuri]|uniref:helix-turn-helix transcriptional regulator n=1 Tax=Mammaliicoccus sciuri TaxID=1296 RepID=UPI002B257E7F|nr:helix-turn-helix transcriptional regulator [Mammaliicoccus sciuri]WQL92607.1 helix-turn-helix transcriptional regulator [Mammaliicoccus sciuri]